MTVSVKIVLILQYLTCDAFTNRESIFAPQASSPRNSFFFLFLEYITMANYDWNNSKMQKTYCKKITSLFFLSFLFSWLNFFLTAWLKTRYSTILSLEDPGLSWVVRVWHDHRLNLTSTASTVLCATRISGNDQDAEKMTPTKAVTKCSRNCTSSIIYTSTL